VIHFRGEQTTPFGQRYEIAYTLKDQSLVLQKDSEHANALTSGLAVMAKLHFANYSGIDLRWLYFFLAMTVCGLIVSGNLLWIDKQARQRKPSVKSLALVSNITLLGSVGILLATAMSFLFERLLPLQLAQRSQWLVYGFVLSLTATAVFLYFNKNKIHCLRILLKLTSLLLVVLVVTDVLLLGNTIIDLWQQGFKAVLTTDIVLIIAAVILGYAGHKLHPKTTAANFQQDNTQPHST
jgi:hypothetical protein